MIGSSIEDAVRLLLAGQVVAFPTETVYGLGALALNPPAVARIFDIKARPRFDPLIVHLATARDAWALCSCRSAVAQQLAESFWPGPLTIVLPKAPIVPDIVTAGLTSVALRVPAHPMARALLEKLDAPLAAPSANRFGRVSPTRADHVDQDLGEAIPLILDGGPCQNGLESTVLSLLGDRPLLLRPGATPREDIEAVIGPIEIDSGHGAAVISPGQLNSHYAPRTPMQPLESKTWPNQVERVGLLALKPTQSEGYAAVEVLSQSGDLLEAAAQLFAALRNLDELNLDRIVCELAPMRGIGVAINDRLLRGCQR
jgi:L-threonylcarbamoyladenylate synthase